MHVGFTSIWTMEGCIEEEIKWDSGYRRLFGPADPDTGLEISYF